MLKPYLIHDIPLDLSSSAQLKKHVLWLSNERPDSFWLSLENDLKSFSGSILVDLLGCNGQSNRFFILKYENNCFDFKHLEKLTQIPLDLQLYCNQNAFKSKELLIKHSVLFKSEIKNLFKGVTP